MLVDLQTSRPGFVIYDSTGNLLKGNEFPEKYRELALYINTNKSALYFESHEGHIIFGCSLRVQGEHEHEHEQEENDQEETLVFIQVFDEIADGIKQIPEFYDNAVLEIRRFESKKYNIIGLWDEGDLNKIKQTDVPKKVLVYTAGKIIAGEKVSIQASDANLAINLIVNVIFMLKSVLFSNFIFIASRYPSESDLSISLNELKPEIIFDPDLKSKISKCAYGYYSLLYFTFNKSNKKFSSRESLAFEIQKKTMAENESTLINSFNSCNALPDLFRIYDGDIEILKCMAFNLIHKKDSEKLIPILKNNSELMKKLMPELIKEIVNSNEIRSFAKKLYEQCENKEIKAYLEVLYYKKYPCSPVDCTFYNTIQRDLIISAINTQKLRHFNALQEEPVKNIADSGRIIKNAVQDMNDSKLTDFVRFIIKVGEKPVNGTKIILDQIFSRWLSIGSISHLFSSEELNKLDLLSDSNYARQCEDKHKESSPHLEKIAPTIETFSDPSSASNFSKCTGDKQKKKDIVLIGALALAGLTLILIGGTMLPFTFSQEAPGNQATYPNANFTLNALSDDSYFSEETNTAYAFAPFSAQFKDTSEKATSIEWNFGDGNKSLEKSLKYTYFTAGNYTLTLNASNEKGISSAKMLINIIEAPYSKNINESMDYENVSSIASGNNISSENKFDETNNETLKACFDYIQSLSSSSTVYFHDRSEGEIVLWEWYFGDGTKSMDNSSNVPISHNYSTAKTIIYKVSLTVTDKYGNTATNYTQVRVN